MSLNTAMTELDAVNIMLRHISERPVNSLVDAPTEANIARQILHDVSRSVQATGLSDNTEFNFELTADINDNFIAPTNALKVVASDPTINVVIRSGKLYDRVNHTFEFTQDTLKFTIITFLDFVDLSEVAKYYISLKASREFQAQYVGDSTQYQLTEMEEQSAYATLNIHEVRQKKRNVFDHPSANSIVSRRYNPPTYYKGLSANSNFQNN